MVHILLKDEMSLALHNFLTENIILSELFMVESCTWDSGTYSVDPEQMVALLLCKKKHKHYVK